MTDQAREILGEFDFKRALRYIKAMHRTNHVPCYLTEDELKAEAAQLLHDHEESGVRESTRFEVSPGTDGSLTLRIVLEKYTAKQR